MNIDKLLTVAGLSDYDKLAATACLLEAKERTNGLLLHKLKARWLMAGKIADALPWKAERLCNEVPEWAEFDIEPTAKRHGTGRQRSVANNRSRR
jgi:hypothetical protein